MDCTAHCNYKQRINILFLCVCCHKTVYWVENKKKKATCRALQLKYQVLLFSLGSPSPHTHCPIFETENTYIHNLPKIMPPIRMLVRSLHHVLPALSDLLQNPEYTPHYDSKFFLYFIHDKGKTIMDASIVIIRTALSITHR